MLLSDVRFGLLLGDTVQIPFLHDLAVHTRLLVAIPLLVVAEMVIAPRLGIIIRHFFSSGLITENDLPEFRQAIADAMRWKESYIAELIILTMVIMLNISRFEIVSTSVLSTWHEVKSQEGMELTAAGWWYICVSKRVFQLLMFSSILVYSKLLDLEK